mgnify:FL=1
MSFFHDSSRDLPFRNTTPLRINHSPPKRLKKRSETFRESPAKYSKSHYPLYERTFEGTLRETEFFKRPDIIPYPLNKRTSKRNEELELMDENRALRSEIDLLKKRITSIRSSIESGSVELERNESAVQLKHELMVAQESNDSLARQLTDIKQKYQRLYDHCIDLESSIQGYKDYYYSIKQVSSRERELQAQLSSVERELQSSRYKYESQIAELRSQLGLKDSEVQELKIKLQKAENYRTQNLATRVEDLEYSISDFENRYSDSLKSPTSSRFWSPKTRRSPKKPTIDSKQFCETCYKVHRHDWAHKNSNN